MNNGFEIEQGWDSHHSSLIEAGSGFLTGFLLNLHPQNSLGLTGSWVLPASVPPLKSFRISIHKFSNLQEFLLNVDRRDSGILLYNFQRNNNVFISN